MDPVPTDRSDPRTPCPGVSSCSPASARSRWPASSACPAPLSPRMTAAFPLTLVDDEGTEVVIDAAAASASSASRRRTPRSSSRSERATGSWAAPTSTTSPPRPPRCPTSRPSRGVIMEQVVDLDPDLVLAAGNYLHARPTTSRGCASWVSRSSSSTRRRSTRSWPTSTSSARPSERARPPRL